ncbi:MAG: hypothetical protein R6U96_14950 [Promethearchaeia archaeon]
MEKRKEESKSAFRYIEPSSAFSNKLEIEDESKTFALWRKYSKRLKK